MTIDINEITKIAAAAGKKILEIYHSSLSNNELEVEWKGDSSPLTAADRAAHQVITQSLLDLYPDTPCLSEEGKSIPFRERSSWNRFWMIDPLDGTKEFIKRNGEFTVNIALIEDNKPIIGVVHVPVSGYTYYAKIKQGAFLKKPDGMPQRLETQIYDENEDNQTIVSSRSHLSPETAAFIQKFRNPILISMGSSLKFMLVAEGKANVYPRFGPTMEWDTAAAQIIVEEAGGYVAIENTDKPLTYNKENLLNPHFIVTGKKPKAYDT